MAAVRFALPIAGLALCALLAGCAVGPDYVKPQLALPAAYKEAPAGASSAGWKPAQPADAGARGAWWTVFGDRMLDDLEAQVEDANPTLAQSEAQYRQAQALVGQARAGFFPSVGVDAAHTRSGSAGAKPVERDSLAFSASWEPDLWGRVRRTLEQGKANAQASAALLASTRLSLQAQLAQDYLQLRITDAQKALLDDTVAGYQRSLQVTQNQYRVGVAARGDVVQAQAQLESARAQALDLGIARAQLEHAIAVLVGKPPAEFSIPVQALAIEPPPIAAGVPSQLLERRPDVAAAERQAAAANAGIGIAESAWFPSLTLSGSGGYQSSTLANWLSAPNRVWSFGPALAASLFDGGARRAQNAAAHAAWDAAVANYRQVALAALQGVEDQLAALRILEQEAAVQDAAVKAAEESLRIAQNQYRAGTVSYLNVVSAQNTAYASRRAAIALLGNRLVASVGLIKALGGGWQAAPQAGGTIAPAPGLMSGQSNLSP